MPPGAALLSFSLAGSLVFEVASPGLLGHGEGLYGWREGQCPIKWQTSSTVAVDMHLREHWEVGDLRSGEGPRRVSPRKSSTP